jgi:hypothetical protein
MATDKSLREEQPDSQCLISTEHKLGRRRIGPLSLEVKHNRREEQIIWLWLGGLVVHEQLLDAFQEQGFTGYRANPATVRFRDGVISTEYLEFIVTGWAGIASPESGIRLVESCPGCPRKRYSPITNYEKVIDWSQWTEEDFFIVWPMAQDKLVTKRVAEWLLARKVKSFRLEDGFALQKKLMSPLKLRGGRLSDWFPEDLAIKYGRPLGLE